MGGLRTTTCKGWLLDVYADPRHGTTLWLLEEGSPPDAPRRCLRQDFPVTFYAAGPNPRLRALWRYLQAQPIPVTLSQDEQRDLFQSSPQRVMAIRLENPLDQERLFAQASRDFPDLTYYDADIPLPLRHAALYGTFPLARIEATVEARDSSETGSGSECEAIRSLKVLDSPWELDPELPSLRILSIEPDCDLRRQAPTHLKLRFEHDLQKRTYCLALEPVRPLLINLKAILRQCDPDVLMTAWGDTWLLPRLLELSEQAGIPLPLNRHPGREPIYRRELTYFSYGRVIHRGQQVHLCGRWHIDVYNAMMFHDYGMEGILESARVTGMPAQAAARLSPGSGISAMQVVTALRDGVLVPWRKQQAEHPKSALELIHADQGGLVYQPVVGLHRDVAEIDFVSMYPGIMVRFNISPETVVSLNAPGTDCQSVLLPESQDILQRESGVSRVPALKLWINSQEPGLVPRTLAPLLDKRIALKTRLVSLPGWDPRRKRYQAHSAAHKWLLVTCFGYLGYKNARFGRIEAHQSVTAYSREALLRAKEAAEEMGFTVLHMYVDGMWVQKPGCQQVGDVQPLLDEILARTQLPIALEGIYRWIAFLPSRVNPKVPVANRYFGAFQDGTLKVRGIEARRGDAPPFVAEAQMHILELLAQATSADQLETQLPQVIAFLRRQCRLLRQGQLPLEKLVVTQKLSRELELYRTPSPPARAAAQLAPLNKKLGPGETVRFVYTRGEPGVHAWDLPEALDPRRVDTARYRTLLLRAASAVLGPLGVDEQQVGWWEEGVTPRSLPGLISAKSPATTPRNLPRPARNHPGGPGPASSQ